MSRDKISNMSKARLRRIAQSEHSPNKERAINRLAVLNADDKEKK